MTGKTFEMGAVGKWGVRGIRHTRPPYGYLFAEVPLPAQGMTSTIEERRRERDLVAQFIIDALNEKVEHENLVEVPPPAIIPVRIKDE